MEDRFLKRLELSDETLSVKSADSGRHRFVISTENVDLQGDIVVQAGLELVSSHIPAQVDHSGQVRDRIGHWDHIKTEGKRTLADLVLIEKGISRTADLVRTLLDAGERMACSIGFKSIKREWIREPDTDEGQITGVRFLRWMLLEASVVVVPANPEALNVAKSLAPDQVRLLEQWLAGAKSPVTESRDVHQILRRARTALVRCERLHSTR